jgi:hypothetical protein
MKRPARLFALFCCLPLLLPAQLIEQEGEHGTDWGGYFFGLKGGLSLGSQDWSGLETELGLGYHVAGFLETIPTRGTFSFWGQLGYHQRGSRSGRRRVITFQGNQVRLPSDPFRFNNISLGIGGKQVVAYTKLADLYYLIGIRGEYTVSTNLGDYDPRGATQGGLQLRRDYPIDSYEFINRFTYGATVGGGAYLLLSEKVGALLELSIHPDLAYQYNQGQINNVANPGGGGNTSIGERSIRNLTFEVSVAFRFLRSFVYID